MDAGSFVIALLAAAGTAAAPAGPPAAAAPAPRCIAAPDTGGTGGSQLAAEAARQLARAVAGSDDPADQRLAAALAAAGFDPEPAATGRGADRTADGSAAAVGQDELGARLTDTARALDELAAALRGDATGSGGRADELDTGRQDGLLATAADDELGGSDGSSRQDRLGDGRLADSRTGDDQLAEDQLPDDRRAGDAAGSGLDERPADQDRLVEQVVDRLADRLTEAPGCGSAAADQAPGAERTSVLEDVLASAAADRQQDDAADRESADRRPTDLEDVLARSAAERERVDESSIAAALERGERSAG